MFSYTRLIETELVAFDRAGTSSGTESVSVDR